VGGWSVEQHPLEAVVEREYQSLRVPVPRLRGFKIPVLWARRRLRRLDAGFKGFTRAREYQIALGFAIQ